MEEINTIYSNQNKLLSDETITLLNYRIQQEQYSSRIYEQIGMWFENEGLNNLSKLYKKYAEEELNHAGWAKTYLLSYDITPSLMLLETPTNSVFWSSIKDILDITLKHELEVTEQCEDLTKFALTTNQFNLFTLGQKYNTEQIEEIEKATTLVSLYERVKDDLIFDQYVGENYL
jgi:ferritin